MPPAAAHTTLVVRHVVGTDPPQFTVSLLSDGWAAPAVAIAPPNSVRVEGRPNDDLTHQLRWYLEQFLEYPFHPDDEYAGRVQAALQKWGRQTFTTLFGSGAARDFYHDATRDGLPNLTVRVASDSPFILGWPWEALEDEGKGRLAQHCAVERRTEKQSRPTTTPSLPTDRVNVLLVIARPLAGDVRYRSVSRSLVEMAAEHTFPISVHVLRPPTFDNLREHLRTHPNHYHILHFDGHGAYRTDAPPPGGGNVMMRAADGRLLFEKDDGTPHPVEADKLSELLRDNAVPAVVLNACQSAMIDDRATDPFASVAAALLKAGTRSVVAMAYALYVSGARQFLPAFYRLLFESGSLAAAVRAGRQQMLARPERVCARGTFPLDDWLVPVVYQQDPPDFSFVTRAAGESVGKRASRLPEEARDDRNHYGFVGRDGAILALERAMHRPPTGILITGLGGVGKTTLVKGFLHWLEQTGGLGAGALWFDFREVRSAEYVLNRLGEALTGKPEFATHGVKEKLDFLADACRKLPLRVVWDNFESARGVVRTGAAGNLSDADAGLLKDLLTRLRGGQTKVLITSRSAEEWLGGPTNVGAPVALGGLDGEERWEFANAVVRDLGLVIDRKDPALAKLMKLLRGHPLAMRVVLAKLGGTTAKALEAALAANLATLLPGAGDEAEAALLATLRFATDSLPAEWQSLLIPLGLHEGYVQAGLLEMMAKAVERGPPWAVINDCLTALGNAGLVRDMGQAIYELHPLLTSYLRATVGTHPSEARETWTRAFVEVMGQLANALAPKPLHEQRFPFLLHEANFHAAQRVAGQLIMGEYEAALTQALAAFALNTRHYPAAAALYDQLQAILARDGREKDRAVAYHQLGMVA
ncbi:MAG TPA: CHAT domain-containing protein, partial [Urbifossiella sp.]|nr:CHAT domain-containing protein [Urbifossiella sp.]